MKIEERNYSSSPEKPGKKGKVRFAYPREARSWSKDQYDQAAHEAKARCARRHHRARGRISASSVMLIAQMQTNRRGSVTNFWKTPEITCLPFLQRGID